MTSSRYCAWHQKQHGVYFYPSHYPYHNQIVWKKNEIEFHIRFSLHLILPKIITFLLNNIDRIKQSLWQINVLFHLEMRSWLLGFPSSFFTQHKYLTLALLPTNTLQRYTIFLKARSISISTFVSTGMTWSPSHKLGWLALFKKQYSVVNIWYA